MSLMVIFMNHEIEKYIGMNIRQIRKARGLTIEEVANKYAAVSGEAISSGLIGAWERNEKRISASQVYFISRSLECSIERLYEQPDADQKTMLERIFSEYRSLSKNDQSILFMACDRWKGNTAALIQSVGMYMSMIRKDRAEVAFMCLHQYEKAREAGRLIPDAPEVDPEFIEQEWFKLLKKKRDD